MTENITTTIQIRSDNTSTWNAQNPTPAVAEPCYDTNTKKLRIGDGVTAYNSLDPVALDSEVKHAKDLADKLYDGVDLTVKFAAEIRNYASVWDWIKARIQSGNYKGIHVGDKIPFTKAAGTVGSDNITAQNMVAQIAGIDTYYGYGYGVPDKGATVVGHHIDFITTTCLNKNIQWNPTDNNNGTATQNNPWLASKIYAYLNGVNNLTTSAFNNIEHGFDASAGGILQLLPTALQNVIVNKALYLGKKYSATGLLNDFNGGHDVWGIGKLWLPTEIEVHGCPIHSSGKAPDGKDWQNYGAPVQYPLFVGSNSYRNNKNKSRIYWWLSSVCGGSSSYACCVSYIGYAYAFGCAYTNISALVCFRIA